MWPGVAVAIRSGMRQAVQGRTEIIDHGREIALQRGSPANYHIIARRWRGDDIGVLHHFAKPAAHAIALGGGADFLGDCEAYADGTNIVTRARLHDEGGPGDTGTLSGGDEIRAFFQPVHDVNRRIGAAGSGAQTLAATCATRGENLAAASRRETGTEAVTALAHQFAGLISPLHGRSPLLGSLLVRAFAE
jgi:hypothetical protein